MRLHKEMMNHIPFAFTSKIVFFSPKFQVSETGGVRNAVFTSKSSPGGWPLDVIYTYLYCFPPVNITKAISQEDKQESEEKIVQRLQGTTLVVARLPCAHCLAVLSAHFIVVCLARFWYVPKLCWVLHFFFRAWNMPLILLRYSD